MSLVGEMMFVYDGQGGVESPMAFIFFPVVVHAMDIVVSSIGILFVRAAGSSTANPMDQLTRGYRWVLRATKKPVETGPCPANPIFGKGEFTASRSPEGRLFKEI